MAAVVGDKLGAARAGPERALERTGRDLGAPGEDKKKDVKKKKKKNGGRGGRGGREVVLSWGRACCSGRGPVGAGGGGMSGVNVPPYRPCVESPS